MTRGYAVRLAPGILWRNPGCQRATFFDTESEAQELADREGGVVVPYPRQRPTVVWVLKASDTEYMDPRGFLTESRRKAMRYTDVEFARQKARENCCALVRLTRRRRP